MESREELKQYYLDNKESLSGNAMRKKETKWFRDAVRKVIPFIEDLGSRKEFGLYTYCLEHDIYEPPECIECGGKVKTASGNRFPETCSASCRATRASREHRKKVKELYGVDHHTQLESVKNKAKQTNLEKYGTTHFMKSDEGKKHHKEKMVERYGVDNVFSLSEIKEKIKKTNREKYGSENPMQNSDILEKAKKTNLERYGFENPMQNKEIFSKAMQTNIERYGVPFYHMTEEFKKKVIEQNMERWGVVHNRQRHISKESLVLLDDKDWMEEQYKLLGGVDLSKLLGVGDGVIYDRLRKHGIDINPTYQSAAERQVNEFIMSLGFDTIQSDRSILGGKELDIVIPEKKIAIEYNGLFWHSFPKRPKNYHKEKTEATNAAGYRLIHIFEDEWKYQQEQMKNKLKSILGVDDRPVVYARKCEVVDMTKDKTKVKDFYNEHHVQGNGGQSLVFALVEEGIPVAMMSFKRRSSVEYDLTRYATSKRVVGGFSKLLKASKNHLKNLGVEFIVSFADKRYSDGNMYLQNGWEHVYDTKPDYQYVIEDMRVRKQNFRRKILEEKLPNFNPDESEMVNMMKHEIFPIYDCGLMKFKMDL